MFYLFAGPGPGSSRLSINSSAMPIPVNTPSMYSEQIKSMPLSISSSASAAARVAAASTDYAAASSKDVGDKAASWSSGPPEGVREPASKTVHEAPSTPPRESSIAFDPSLSWGDASVGDWESTPPRPAHPPAPAVPSLPLPPPGLAIEGTSNIFK